MRAFATRPAFLADVATDFLRVILGEARIDRDHVSARLIEAELFYRQPIVAKPDYIGWTATRGDYDLDDRVGHGRTEAEAIEDLLEGEEWDRERAAAEFDDGGMAEERARHP